MTGSATDADAIVLLRHIPGGVHYQGKPPPRITSENFKLRRNRDSGGIEAGISVSTAKYGNLLCDARRVLGLRGTGRDSRIAYARKQAVESAGFLIQDDPIPDDASHCIIRSATTRLEDHSGRKRLAETFDWVELS